MENLPSSYNVGMHELEEHVFPEINIDLLNHKIFPTFNNLTRSKMWLCCYVYDYCSSLGGYQLLRTVASLTLPFLISSVQATEMLSIDTFGCSV